MSAWSDLLPCARLVPELPKLLPRGRWSPARLLEKNARERPRQAALLYLDERYSWGEVEARANQYAHCLSSRGVGRGDVVALLMDNRPDFLFIELGLSKLGAVTALLNTNLSGRSLAHAVAAARPRAVVVGAEHEARLAGLELGDGLADRVLVQSETGDGADFNRQVAAAARTPVRTSAPRASDPTSYIYTSGTTGLPKAAVVTNQRYLGASALFGRVMHQLVPGDVLYVTLPLYHSSAQWMGWGACMLAGATMALRRKFSAQAFWPDVERHGATHLLYIGELCRYLLETPPSPAERHHRLRVAVGNGLRADVWTRFQARFRIPVIREFYGATEGNALLVNLAGRPGMVGRLLPGQRLLRCDPVTGAPARGADGLCQPIERGTGLLVAKISRFARFDGYVDAKASTKKVVRDVLRAGDAYFDSGDLLTLHEDRWVSFADRVGDTYRWKGENVSTSEVAETLGGAPGVLESNVYGVEVPRAEGRVGMASLRVADDFDLGAFAAFVRERLPAYQRPYFLRLQRELDVTGTFKHQKVDCRSQGYDPGRSNDPLYCLHENHYERIDHDLHERIQRGEIGPR